MMCDLLTKGRRFQKDFRLTSCMRPLCNQHKTIIAKKKTHIGNTTMPFHSNEAGPAVVQPPCKRHKPDPVENIVDLYTVDLDDDEKLKFLLGIPHPGRDTMLEWIRIQCQGDRLSIAGTLMSRHLAFVALDTHVPFFSVRDAIQR